MVEDALAANAMLRMILVRDDIDPELLDSLSRERVDVAVVAAPLFDRASDVNRSQGIAAICTIPRSADPDELKVGDALILDQMRDPGNMGTILRSAAAAGISTVIVMPSSVDPFSPKVVRAGMGAHFRLRIGDFDARWADALRSEKIEVVHADMRGDLDYDVFDWVSRFALVVGGETQPLSHQLTSLIDASVRIPMAGNVESLNAAVATSILLFEAIRQRQFRAPLR